MPLYRRGRQQSHVCLELWVIEADRAKYSKCQRLKYYVIKVHLKEWIRTTNRMMAEQRTALGLFGNYVLES